ncbi:kinetochore protein Nuf2 [Pseudoscourfieldia marina]
MSYSFPILTNAEILACLSELDVPLSEVELTKPGYEIARPMYESITVLLCGVSREEMQTPAFNAIASLGDFPELHEESLANLAFVRNLVKLLEASGVSDFSLKDIYKPDYTRLRRNLSAIINFAKFREEKLATYVELQEEAEATLEKKAALDAKAAELRAEIARIRASHQAEASQTAEVLEAAENLRTQVADAQKNRETLEAANETTRNSIAALADKTNVAKDELSRHEARKAFLQDSVVTSPDKLTREISDLENAIERERTSVGELDKTLRNLNHKGDLYAKASREIGKCVKLMEEAESEIGKHKEVSRSVKAIQVKLGENEEEVFKLTAAANHMKRQESALSERLTRLGKQGNLKKESAASALNEAKADLASVESDVGMSASKLEEYEAHVRKTTSMIRELQASHEAEASKILEQYHQLRQQVKDYNASLIGSFASGDNALTA